MNWPLPARLAFLRGTPCFTLSGNTGKYCTLCAGSFLCIWAYSENCLNYPLPVSYFFTWPPSTHISKRSSCVISSQKHSLITLRVGSSPIPLSLNCYALCGSFYHSTYYWSHLYRLWTPGCQKPHVLSLCVILFYCAWAMITIQYIFHDTCWFFLHFQNMHNIYTMVSFFLWTFLLSVQSYLTN